MRPRTAGTENKQAPRRGRPVAKMTSRRKRASASHAPAKTLTLRPLSTLPATLVAARLPASRRRRNDEDEEEAEEPSSGEAEPDRRPKPTSRFPSRVPSLLLLPRLDSVARPRMGNQLSKALGAPSSRLASDLLRRMGADWVDSLSCDVHQASSSGARKWSASRRSLNPAGLTSGLRRGY